MHSCMVTGWRGFDCGRRFMVKKRNVRSRLQYNCSIVVVAFKCCGAYNNTKV